ncbi:MAG: type I DNA topoisomerase [Muribaculaceae bacterium]|nr:type I DNA topoisomerase [Muribaculaceae bacterium]
MSLKNLVIVESPAKAKTIEKFLGTDYKVLSSYGHIRDLHKKDFSIDIEHDFKPIYEIPAEKKELVATLKKNAKSAETVWLASDEDREGEAISWHLYETLGLKPDNTKRIVFHEITKSAILNAIDNPRSIDMALVDAQQARRVLDRIVGFELSPVLWRKIKRGLSAGRVQSVAVRLIVEREKEIENFKTETYYRVVAEFSHQGHSIRTELSRRLASEAEAREFLEACKNATFEVADIQVKELKKSPAAPFTTSTLQQEANRKLGFSVAQTMSIAQKLYEAGHITYMRTDSLNLSGIAIHAISEEIKANMGEQYLRVRKYHTTSKGAQEAHEAIRPTYIDKHSISGTVAERRLYDLIWKRAVASQMSEAIVEKTNVSIAISGRKETFVASGEMVKFDGFLKVYIESSDDDDATAPEGLLPRLEKGDILNAENISASMRYTQHPPRFNEATLVKKLEELGIGRPSTYAPIISTIIAREYVVKGEKEGTPRPYTTLTLADGNILTANLTENVGAEKGKLIPTDTGRVVNDFLEEYFPNIMNYNFTAGIEERFDEIAEGKLRWQNEIANFYKPFHESVEKIANLRLEHRVGERILGNDPVSGRVVSVKIGRFGPLVQIGTTDDADKPLFASLPADKSVNSITLDEALELFKLPRTLGEFEGKEVVVSAGRFGPYVKHDGKYVSIPASLSPLSITLEEAQELIEKKRQDDSNKILATYSEEPGLQVLNGRFGPYIAFNKKNYKIPKGTDAASLTLEQCREIIAKQDAEPTAKKPARRKAASAKKK